MGLYGICGRAVEDAASPPLVANRFAAPSVGDMRLHCGGAVDSSNLRGRDAPAPKESEPRAALARLAAFLI